MEVCCHEAARLRHHRYWFVLNQPAIALLAIQLALQQYGEVLTSWAEGIRASWRCFVEMLAGDEHRSDFPHPSLQLRLPTTADKTPVWYCLISLKSDEIYVRKLSFCTCLYHRREQQAFSSKSRRGWENLIKTEDCGVSHHPKCSYWR